MAVPFSYADRFDAIMEVYLSLADYTQLPLDLMVFRYCAQNMTRAAWELLPGAEMTLLREGQRERRIVAENAAIGGVYCLADDDCVPPANLDLDEVRLIFETHPEFGMLSLLPAPAILQKWTEFGSVMETGKVEEHVSVGGIRFIRKGAMPDWPEQQGAGYDRTHADRMREAGFRVGYLKSLPPCLHVGDGRSAIWR